jgi:hypothetical protein
MSAEANAKKHEFIGVFLLLIGILLLVCLFTYNPRDASYNTLSLKPVVENQIGRMGAFVSDWLYQFFGFASFLLLGPPLILSWKLIFGKEIHSPYLRAFGFVLLVVGASAALQLFPFLPREMDFKPGGLIGKLMVALLLPNLNRTGSYIVIAGALILGILASTSLSLSKTFSRTSLKSAVPHFGIWDRIKKWRENRKPVRAVVNIKSTAHPSLNLTPRPDPVKPPLTALLLPHRSGSVRVSLNCRPLIF